jgi:GNAT superfamily N-acetyltransferase
MEKLIIRKATFADIPAMIELLRQLFSIEADFIFNSKKHEQGLALLIDSKEIANILVACINCKVVGMLSALINISTAEGKMAITLEDMVVDECFRTKGIGTKLMSVMEQWAEKKGVTRLQLLADKTNVTAFDYYKKLGWQSTQMVCLRKFTSIHNE